MAFLQSGSTSRPRLAPRMQLAAVYKSHDLYVLKGLADRVAVMYAGQIVEVGPASQVLERPRHPYSSALLAAAPRADTKLTPLGIPGAPPASIPVQGCAFAPRCPRAKAACWTVTPSAQRLGASIVRCHYPLGVGPDRPTIRAEKTIGSDARPVGNKVLEVREVCCSYGTKERSVTVVNDVSLDVAQAETIAVVGESGSGKSTLLRAWQGYTSKPRDKCCFAANRYRSARSGPPPRPPRSDPNHFPERHHSLNPRRTVGETISRYLKLFRPDVDRSGYPEQVLKLLQLVKLPPSASERLPSELSGGQRQRVAFARAFASPPRLLLCDEVTSALDVSVQATILGLIRELADEFGTAIVFVSHDLAVVRSIAHRVNVMWQGVICESGPTDEIFLDPKADYTKLLLAAVPSRGASQSATSLA